MKVAATEIVSLRKVYHINWISISRKTQIRLLEMLARKVKAPHLRFLTHSDLAQIRIEAIGRTLNGMYQFYSLQAPKEDKDSVVDYMLDQLGIEKNRSTNSL